MLYIVYFINNFYRLTVQDFVKRFMVIHWYIFEENVEKLMRNDSVEEIVYQFESLLSSSESDLRNLSTILKKVLFILIFTIWNLRNGSGMISLD
jgi:hypothetical protein